MTTNSGMATVEAQHSYDINTVETKYQVDIVDYETMDLSQSVSAMNTAMTAYQALIRYNSELQTIGIEDLKGTSIEMILEGMGFIPRYISDYHHTMLEYKSLIQQTHEFLQSVDNCTLIREINNV